MMEQSTECIVMFLFQNEGFFGRFIWLMMFEKVVQRWNNVREWILRYLERNELEITLYAIQKLFLTSCLF